MADEEHVVLLKRGRKVWNVWREANPDVVPDLGGADLVRADLNQADLSGANLNQADLSGANLGEADLIKANLGGANLIKANLGEANLGGAYLVRANLGWADLGGAYLGGVDLGGANLSGADLSGADLGWADLGGANLGGANLGGADLVRANLGWAALVGANLSGADLSGANLSGADLSGADLVRANLGGAALVGANLSGADLSGADLSRASLVETNFTNANITSCRIYGISAWDVKLEGTKQRNLIITTLGQTHITVDDLEVAQFIYLLLHNEKIRHVIDAITSKAVLILGRFTLERKAVLDALRDELRRRDRTPIVFDFDKPQSKSVTDTVKLLAQMARYVIVDLSDPNSAFELGIILMLGLRTTPVVPIIVDGQKPFPMLDDVLREPWSTDLITYRDLDDLRALLDARLASMAEAKVLELRGPQAG